MRDLIARLKDDSQFRSYLTRYGGIDASSYLLIYGADKLRRAFAIEVRKATEFLMTQNDFRWEYEDRKAVARAIQEVEGVAYHGVYPVYYASTIAYSLGDLSDRTPLIDYFVTYPARFFGQKTVKPEHLDRFVHAFSRFYEHMVNFSRRKKELFTREAASLDDEIDGCAIHTGSRTNYQIRVALSAWARKTPDIVKKLRKQNVSCI